MIECMAVLDDDLSVDATPLAGGDGRIGSPPMGLRACGRRDRQSPYERAAALTRRPRSREAERLRKALDAAQAHNETIRALRREVRCLRKAVREAETHEGTIRS